MWPLWHEEFESFSNSNVSDPWRYALTPSFFKWDMKNIFQTIFDKLSNNLISKQILGSDGYQADYVQVETDTGYYKCYFHEFLDNDDSEQGSNCIAA